MEFTSCSGISEQFQYLAGQYVIKRCVEVWVCGSVGVCVDVVVCVCGVGVWGWGVCVCVGGGVCVCERGLGCVEGYILYIIYILYMLYRCQSGLSCVKLLRNAPWPPNLVRNQRSERDHLGSKIGRH